MELVTKEFDSYIHHQMIDGGKTVFIAKLSNGEEIWADDDRPGLEEWDSWKRLKEYVEKNNLSILEVKLRYKSHIETLPSNKDGYYLGRGCYASLLGNKYANRTQHFVAGYVEDGKIYIKWYRVPELTVTQEEVRDVSEHPCLILNRGQ